MADGSRAPSPKSFDELFRAASMVTIRGTSKEDTLTVPEDLIRTIASKGKVLVRRFLAEGDTFELHWEPVWNSTRFRVLKEGGQTRFDALAMDGILRKLFTGNVADDFQRFVARSDAEYKVLLITFKSDD